MRTRLLGLSIFLACAGALPACSAIGLDHLPQSDCVSGEGGMMGDAFCADLATTNPPPDNCHTWQCNEQSRHCELLPKDDDGDGAPSMMCAAGGAYDCDDTNASNVPMGTETCDGLDQNCDGIPDDGAIAASAMSSSLTTIDPGAPQLLLTYQPDMDAALLMARYASPAKFHAVFVTATASANDLAFSQTGTGAIVPSVADGAIAALGGGTYALMAQRMNACRQWMLAPVTSGSAAVTLRATDESALPACPGSGTQQLSAPVIAGHANGAAAGDTILAAWLGGPEDARSCGAAAALPVSIGAAAFDDRATAHNRIGATTVTLGESVDNGSPALLALADGFVLAYARADMTIAVHLVTVDATTLAITANTTPDYVEPAGSALPQGVSLALGPTSGGATSIALSYYTGCGGSNPITVHLLSRSGSAITGSSTPTTGLGTGVARSLVRAVYQPRASEWVVGWRSASGLGVQRLFHDGATEGDAFDVVTSSSVSAFVVEPLAMGPLYRAIVVDGTALNQITFGCAAP